ncbi:beta family protein [Methylibium petroleiphilum]|uniref:T4 beta protein n=1 Tax=Methylibium petroleiphilum (strain ATCC BAA-1232 / LMG 22953 / PM1) TaxID=420662 RepID=A2SH57_METPP|nr:beta family protein [Methylibium petroleiphilum]ABM94896.1 hypothetical protein Mpe_A1938 [Methylibium petroleiphilum PM1]
MINISFDGYSYYPTLRTRQAELKGLEMLDPYRKRQIVPLLTLGRWPKAIDFVKSAERAAAAMPDLPYFLDLTTDGNHLADQQLALRNPVGAFEAWRRFTAQYPRAIPVVQIVSGARVRDVTKQAQEIERAVGKVAFRIKEFSAETAMVVNALSALDNPRNAIVFIDCQYIRSALSAYATATIASINQLRIEYPELMIVVLSTSFPSSTLSFAGRDQQQQRGSIDILERDLHARIGGSPVAAYGDHGSVHSVVYDDAQVMRWVPRVDYPRQLDWYFERRSGVDATAGYVSAAQAVLATDAEIGSRDIWGEDMIRQAAGGTPHGKAPSSWISVRVNIHLARQIDFSAKLGAGLDAEEDTEE